MTMEDPRLHPVRKRYVDSKWKPLNFYDFYVIISFDVIPYYCSLGDLQRIQSRLSGRVAWFICNMNYFPMPGLYLYVCDNG